MRAEQARIAHEDGVAACATLTITAHELREAEEHAALIEHAADSAARALRAAGYEHDLSTTTLFDPIRVDVTVYVTGRRFPRADSTSRPGVLRELAAEIVDGVRETAGTPGLILGTLCLACLATAAVGSAVAITLGILQSFGAIP